MNTCETCKEWVRGPLVHEQPHLDAQYIGWCPIQWTFPYQTGFCGEWTEKERDK